MSSRIARILLGSLSPRIFLRRFTYLYLVLFIVSFTYSYARSFLPSLLSSSLISSSFVLSTVLYLLLFFTPVSIYLVYCTYSLKRAILSLLSLCLLFVVGWAIFFSVTDGFVLKSITLISYFILVSGLIYGSIFLLVSGFIVYFGRFVILKIIPSRFVHGFFLLLLFLSVFVALAFVVSGILWCSNSNTACLTWKASTQNDPSLCALSSIPHDPSCYHATASKTNNRSICFLYDLYHLPVDGFMQASVGYYENLLSCFKETSPQIEADLRLLSEIYENTQVHYTHNISYTYSNETGLVSFTLPLDYNGKPNLFYFDYVYYRACYERSPSNPDEIITCYRRQLEASPYYYSESVSDIPLFLDAMRR